MKEKKDHHFIKKPIYPGGNTAFREFIYSHLKYPKEALDEKIEGIVLCRYEIDYKGNVSKVKVKKGIGFGCDEEAVRILKLLKWEIPKEPRKLRVSFNKETKIKFQLPKAKPVQKKAPKQNKSNRSIQYTITKKVIEKAETTPAKKSKIYTYTVKL